MLHAGEPFAPPSFAPPPRTDAQAELFRLLLAPDAAVDPARLRRAARAGVPSDVRAAVWKLLLGIAPTASSPDLARHANREHEYAELCKSLDSDDEVARGIRAVLKRSRSAYQPMSTHEKKSSRQGSTSGESCEGDEEEEESPPPLPDATIGNGAVQGVNGRPIKFARAGQRAKLHILDRDIVQRFTRVINIYLEGTGGKVEYHSDLVQLCAPFVELMPTEADAYYGFNALMQRHAHLFTNEGLQEAVSEFITLFRTLHRDLHDHFVSEEVDMTSWVRKWLRGLLVQQLPRRSLLRLWDYYFANLGKDNLRLHPYVCLVFIEHIKPELQDCDDKERITGLLGKLPAIDIDYVIAHAMTTREELRETGIL